MDQIDGVAGGGPGEATTATADARRCDDGGDSSRKRILLLDGVRLFVHLERTMLERSDYEIHTAASASEAFALMDEVEFDLILMDYVLPDQQGHEVVQQIRAQVSVEPEESRRQDYR